MSANCYKNTYKMIIVSIILLLAIIPNSITVEIADVETSLSKVLNFIDEQVDQFGLDGIFGVVIAQSQMIKILNLPVPYIILSDIRNLITKCQLILENSKKFLPIYPSYMLTFQIRLLNSKNWIRSLPDNITFGDIPNTGFYKNWTSEIILSNKKAEFRGVKSDVCLKELLEYSTNNDVCFLSKFCQEMMLNVSRIDSGYLLTHRLLYLQIKRLQGYRLPGDMTDTKGYTKLFCTYIYKEAKTSEYLGYPYHDIFLEQVVLCGMEGFSEFLNENWLEKILKWQNPHGCYESVNRNVEKRTSRVVAYGCSDHSTGLGAAAMSLYLKYLIIEKYQINK